MTSEVGTQYAARAHEYVDHLGSMSSVHPADEHLVASWAAAVGGPVLDAGCGPGHWSGHLAARSVPVRGLDQVPAFVEHAHRTHPGVSFDLGDVDALPYEPDAFSGVLAWYSLIHHDPSSIRSPLREFARVLRPGGGLLVGFFTGSTVEPFGHAITTAWRWAPDPLADELRASGFDVLETHTRTGSASGPRPHGAILARLA
ncbi:class I SAM-dependent methyltransferase [Frigoribacterium sp. RIT-PI-h]|uniref:class I SAM-dependent methyltransferase n=1 Tax=Frigoribacterium sp. RIT-PI-h TaxID=1690245 RepID=UPI0006B8D9E8|nr:class I SAM-dependent methyltransferase [Frigoribacterium sp. RIT-PI-h]KPG87551.1 SAM-dependent methyltransferase [Frigoribacterium sp. RIT-PI-h]